MRAPRFIVQQDEAPQSSISRARLRADNRACGTGPGRKAVANRHRTDGRRRVVRACLALFVAVESSGVEAPNRIRQSANARELRVLEGRGFFRRRSAFACDSGRWLA